MKGWAGTVECLEPNFEQCSPGLSNCDAIKCTKIYKKQNKTKSLPDHSTAQRSGGPLGCSEGGVRAAVPAQEEGEAVHRDDGGSFA